MEVQDHSDQDGRVSEEQAAEMVRVEPGKAYPVRLLHYPNGMIVIGYVIAVFPETTMVLRPYTVQVSYNEASDNVDEYEFAPYLDQMAYYSPTDLTPVPFMNGMMIAMLRPSEHLVQNYTGVVRLREAITATPEDEHLELMYDRQLPSQKTLH